MTLKERLLKYWNDNKQVIVSLLVTLLMAILGVGGYELGQENPNLDAAIDVVERVKTKTPMPTQSKATRTPIASITFTPSPTLALTSEGTPIPVTPPIITPSPTSVDIHNNKVWHLPKAEAGFEHHHGINPNDYVEVFGQPLVDYLATYGEISYPWHTPNENDETGFGHHTAYVWLYDKIEGDVCNLFNNGGQIPVETMNCVTDILTQVHTDGTQFHLRKRFHSDYIFLRICEQDNGKAVPPCGVVGTGGWVDYGILETPYKEQWCPLPGIDPLAYTLDNPPDLNQPPYRTSQKEIRGNVENLFNPEYFFWNLIDLNDVAIANQGWSGLRPNASIQNDYDLGNGKNYPYNVPNQTRGIVWNSIDAWGVIDPFSCSDPELDVMLAPDGSSAWNNTAFQIFTVFLYQHPPVPDTGYEVYWTTRWGEFVDVCGLDEVDCVPFYISANLPEGIALFNRQAIRDTTIVLEFEVPGGGVIQPAPTE